MSGIPSIASSKVTMTTILSQRKAGPWKRDIEKTKGTATTTTMLKRNELSKFSGLLNESARITF